MRFSMIVRTCMFSLLAAAWMFSMVEYQNLLLVAANISKDIWWYRWGNSEIRRYNESLWLAQSWSLLEAKSLLSPLIHTPGKVPPEQVLELYGDILYTLSGSRDDVATLYRQSLSYHQNLRVEKKLSLLAGTSSWQTSQANGSWQTSVFASWSLTVSGEHLREATRTELQKIQEQRKGLVNQNAMQSQDIRARTQEVFQILDWGSVQKDW